MHVDVGAGPPEPGEIVEMRGLERGKNHGVYTVWIYSISPVYLGPSTTKYRVGLYRAGPTPKRNSYAGTTSKMNFAGNFLASV